MSGLTRSRKDKMTDQYFWADEVKDKNIDPDSNPAEYFATMKYPEDQWSRITSSKGLGEIADASGYDEGFGYNLTFWEKEGYIFADVNFVYPNSPAAKAGLKRGRPDHSHGRGKDHDGKLHKFVLRIPDFSRAIKR